MCILHVFNIITTFLSAFPKLFSTELKCPWDIICCVKGFHVQDWRTVHTVFSWRFVIQISMLKALRSSTKLSTWCWVYVAVNKTRLELTKFYGHFLILSYYPCFIWYFLVITTSFLKLLFYHLWHCVLLIFLIFFSLFFLYLPHGFLFFCLPLKCWHSLEFCLSPLLFYTLSSPENFIHSGTFKHHICCWLIVLIRAHRQWKCYKWRGQSHR